jgi:hypothetical protein
MFGKLKLAGKLAVCGAAAGLVLGGGLTAAVAMTQAAGPFYPQGAIVDLCIGPADQVYAEAGRDAGRLGSCAAGYTQLPVVSDPGGYVIPASSSGDVVTVAYPGAQTYTEGVAITPLDMTASSNQGHTISWAASSNPAGLIGTGELTINPATGVISGTPTGITGTYEVTVVATDSAGTAGQTQFAVTINP